MEASERNVTLYDVFSITAKLLNADAKAAKGSVQFVVDDSQTSEAGLANGEARFTGRISKPGKHVITATYLEDANLAPSPSTSLSVNVVSSFFTLSPSPDLELKLPSHSLIPSVINGSGTAMLTIANEGDVASTEGANRGTLGLPRGNYPITVFAVGGSGDAEIRKTLVVKLRVN